MEIIIDLKKKNTLFLYETLVSLGRIQLNDSVLMKNLFDKTIVIMLKTKKQNCKANNRKM